MAAFVAYERQGADNYEDTVGSNEMHWRSTTSRHRTGTTWQWPTVQRFDDARQSLDRAVEIDGQNRLYREALELLPPKLNQF